MHLAQHILTAIGAVVVVSTVMGSAWMLVEALTDRAQLRLAHPARRIIRGGESRETAPAAPAAPTATRESAAVPGLLADRDVDEDEIADMAERALAAHRAAYARRQYP